MRIDGKQSLGPRHGRASDNLGFPAAFPQLALGLYEVG